MKTRVISAIIAAIIFIPIFIIGGNVFKIAIYVVTLMGLREFMKARSNDNKIPDFIRFIAYLLISFLYFECVMSKENVLSFDYRIIAGIFLTLLLPVVLYHDEKTYNIDDAFYLVGGVLFLGFSMALFSFYRNISLELIIFLFLITIITDSYAYFTGKHKLLEVVSPKKTWEGTIGGSLVGCFVSTVYYLVIINPNASIFVIGLITLFLSLIGQFGDLFFSAVKRKYGIKDFSNIMPGHGGVLDRLDSIIFVMLAFTFFINIL